MTEQFIWFVVNLVLNPFLANVPILYPLKPPENLWFSGVFRGYKMGTLARNGLSKSKGTKLKMFVHLHLRTYTKLRCWGFH